MYTHLRTKLRAVEFYEKSRKIPCKYRKNIDKYVEIFENIERMPNKKVESVKNNRIVLPNIFRPGIFRAIRNFIQHLDTFLSVCQRMKHTISAMFPTIQ